MEGSSGCGEGQCGKGLYKDKKINNKKIIIILGVYCSTVIN